MVEITNRLPEATLYYLLSLRQVVVKEVRVLVRPLVMVALVVVVVLVEPLERELQIKVMEAVLRWHHPELREVVVAVLAVQGAIIRQRQMGVTAVLALLQQLLAHR